MNETTQGTPTRAYLVAWIVLLFLTAIEVSVVLVFTLPTVVRVTVLLISALIKASLIGAYYMNLKFERLAMMYIALIPLLLLILMFFTIVPDAAHILGVR